MSLDLLLPVAGSKSQFRSSEPRYEEVVLEPNVLHVLVQFSVNSDLHGELCSKLGMALLENNHSVSDKSD